MSTADLKQHPLGAMYPHMSEEDYESLKKDIQENGFNSDHPITLFEDMVLDGFHRHLACLELDIKGEYRHFIAPDMAKTAMEFVIRENDHRRHCTVGQRAMIAQKMAEFLLEEPIPEIGANLHRTVKQAEKEAAKIAKVSPRTVASAAALKKSDPKAAEQVAAGKTTLNAAKKDSGQKQEKYLKAVKVVEDVLGAGFVTQAKMSTAETVRLSHIVAEEMIRIKPYLMAGWKVKAALGHQSVSLTHAHTIRQLLDRAIEFGRFTLEIDGWVVTVDKKE